MNFEEMLNVQEGRNPHRENTPFGSYYRRQIDGKYRNVIELKPNLTESTDFCETIKSEQQWSTHQRVKQQLHFELHIDSSGIYEIELEQGNFTTLASLLDQNPAAVAGKDFIEDILNALFDCTAKLHEENVYHLCFAPYNTFVRKNDSTPFLLSHGSFYSVDDRMELFAEAKDYLAPEILRGESGDQRSDIYSLGCLIAYLYNQGSMPYEYKQVVKKATAENPSKRYKSIEQMRKAISQKRYARNSLIMFGIAVAISLLAVYLYIDNLPEPTSNFEYEEHAQQPTYDLFSDDELDVDTAFLDDTIDLSDEALMQKAEMIYRKRYQKAADEILSKVYNNKHMGSSEKTFMANSQSMAEDLLKAQQKLAGEAGLPDGLAGRIGHEIVEQLTQQKQKGLSRNGYIKAKSGDDNE